MELDFLEDEPKLILTYPHKSKFSRIYSLSMLSLGVIVILIIKHLLSYGTDFAGKIIIVIVLIFAPILIFFMAYSLFLNGVKLEIYENNAVKYYTYGGRGHSVLHFKFELKDIEQIKIKNRPFNCSKLTLKIRNPIFCGLYARQVNKLRTVSIITDRKNLETFMKEMEQFQGKQAGL
ncbi:hypothetical protein [Baileyella intestinalis]|uniref:hypothetical protein n=1 Tax=Baileyella intestinalis TaxID=2606709 RepID=UPI0022E48998|nr:hypothetical protein [Baileyella intestinalis]